MDCLFTYVNCFSVYLSGLRDALVSKLYPPSFEAGEQESLKRLIGDHSELKSIVAIARKIEIAIEEIARNDKHDNTVYRLAKELHLLLLMFQSLFLQHWDSESSLQELYNEIKKINS
jgi:hypothetical protein